MNCWRPDTSKATPALALWRTACTDLPPWAYPQPTRDSPAPLRERLRRAYGCRGGGEYSEYRRASTTITLLRIRRGYALRSISAILKLGCARICGRERV